MSESNSAVHARGVVKRYENGRIVALDGLDLTVERGEFVALCGPSGCGKSTLLNMIARIDRPDSGSIAVAGRNLDVLDEPATDAFRSQTVGLVFQLHNLLPNLTAAENVQVPMMVTDRHRAERRKRSLALLDRVGLGDRTDALPSTLSGGERQRVAIARALANRPQILLADEPTGALDSSTSDRLLDLLAELRAETGLTLIVVTHETHVAQRAGRIAHMLDGKIV